VRRIDLLMGLSLQEDDKPFQVRLSDESFETYELDPPSYTLDTTKAELKQMYYDMVAVRYA
jgi:pyruvate dehydrogenase E1 component alpha subunit